MNGIMLSRQGNLKMNVSASIFMFRMQSFTHLCGGKCEHRHKQTGFTSVWYPANRSRGTPGQQQQQTMGQHIDTKALLIVQTVINLSSKASATISSAHVLLI